MKEKLEKFKQLEHKIKEIKSKICLDISKHIESIGDEKFSQVTGIPISSVIKYRLGTQPSTKLMKEILEKIKNGK